MNATMQHITAQQPATRNQSKGAAMFQLYETLLDYDAVARAFQSDTNNVRAAVSREKKRAAQTHGETSDKFDAVLEKSSTNNFKVKAVKPAPGGNVRSVAAFFSAVALWSTFILPTLASVANTYGISEAFSVHWTTSALVTIVVSGTPVLYLIAGVKSWPSILILGITMGLEAFSNMAQTFKSLMGSLEYSWTFASGTPSNLLNMVSVMTDSDHFKTALCMSAIVAVVLFSAQAVGMWHILKQKEA